jgi:hypothetical protein
VGIIQIIFSNEAIGQQYRAKAKPWETKHQHCLGAASFVIARAMPHPWLLTLIAEVGTSLELEISWSIHRIPSLFLRVSLSPLCIS